MKKSFLVLVLLGASLSTFGADGPPPEAFRVLPPVTAEGPTITPYLKYQTEMAWNQDEERRKEWAQIRTEADLIRIQHKMQESLLAMLGGLPSERTPLHARITGKIALDGFHIEKLIYESLPGVYVSALVYVPTTAIRRIPEFSFPRGTRRMARITTRCCASDWFITDTS